ncbi:ABC transporter permease [Limisalsivibrio acetivorans]|uniref:ABC transporter permease n=1 Tax=Limisalsivibrio acetivorans TaxID=1304888 RepID=UPI0003B457B7|nr:ABC transporter permease [Limisalsivibrio acetivorans]
MMKIGLPGVLISLAGLFFSGFLNEKPNRLMAGEDVGWTEIVNTAGMLTVPSLLILSLLILIPAKRSLRIISAIIASTVLFILIKQSGDYASAVRGANSIARVSLSGGFWFTALGIYILLLSIYTSAESKVARIAPALFPLAAVIIPLYTGYADDLSIMIEFAGRKSRFYSEVVNHIYLAGGSVLTAVIIGIPAGIAAFRYKKAGERIFDVLSIIQTIPSLAMFGLLIVPMAFIGNRFPELGKLGISGIGWAPASIALVLYALLPVVRNVYAGLVSLESGVREAARGMGMTQKQILIKIEMPLTLPLVINGARVALVQCIGNTAVAALIGAGGLGIFIFQGLGQSAVDLILLGCIPTIAIAVAADLIMQFLGSAAGRLRVDKTE